MWIWGVGLLVTILLVHWVQWRERNRRRAEAQRERAQKRADWHRRRRAARKEAESSK